MKKFLLPMASLVLAASLSACAHTGGGGGGGGAYFEDCGYDGDCYGGAQYTCVVNQPIPSPARMQVMLAEHNRSTHRVGPRGDPGRAATDGGTSSSSSSMSSPPSVSVPTVSRAPVVVASPSVDRGSPRAPN